ncbi:hypothetical protein ES703_44210 [subsurface metagenome]
MSSIKRRIRRNQENRERPLEVEVSVRDGRLNVFMSVADWKGGPSFADTGLPDGHLRWLADKILNKIGQARPKFHCGLCRIAHEVIDEEKPALMALAKGYGDKT